jgi:hypothetical protein
MDRIAGWIEGIGRIDDLVAVEIDFDQAGRGHHLEEHAVRIDQKMMLGARYARGDVRKDQVVPAMHRHQAV